VWRSGKVRDSNAGTQGPKRAAVTPRPRAALLALALGGLIVSAAPGEALAYRTVADELGVPGPVVRGSLWVAVLVQSATTGAVPAEVLAASARDAAAAWVSDCSPLRLEVMPMSSAFADESDGLTSIVVIESGWEARGYGATRAAITESRYVRVGEQWMIADADILVNADTFDWTATDAPSLTAILVHELGHAIGLAHPCEFGGVAGEPECAAMPEIASAAVMFPRYQPGAEALRPDDLAGLCALYPTDPCAGVACGAAEMCVAGECVERLICAGQPCTGACAEGGDDPGACVSTGARGAPCAMGEACASRLCLTSMSLGGYCTVGCTDDSECGTAEVCRSFDVRRVCAPRQSVGCRASAASPTSPAGSSARRWWGLLVLVLVSLRRPPRRNP
jgi:hypothetical protein